MVSCCMAKSPTSQVAVCSGSPTCTAHSRLSSAPSVVNEPCPNQASMSETTLPAATAGLRPALLRLDLRLRLAVEALRGELTERARDPFRGLYISEADVDELLASASPAELAERHLAGPVLPGSPRVERLAQLFDLDAFEQEALLV